MHRLILRVIWTLSFIGLGYCLSHPESSHRFLNWYIESRTQPDGYLSMISPRKDIEIAKAAIDLLERQCLQPGHEVQGPAYAFDEAFFDDVEPIARPTVHPDLKRSTGVFSGGLRYAPIETGVAVQSNPNLQ